MSGNDSAPDSANLVDEKSERCGVSAERLRSSQIFCLQVRDDLAAHIKSNALRIRLNDNQAQLRFPGGRGQLLSQVLAGLTVPR